MGRKTDRDERLLLTHTPKTEKREIILGACKRQMGKSNATGRGQTQTEKRAEANSKGGWGGGGNDPVRLVFSKYHMTAAMCWKLLPVNYLPQKPLRKNMSAISEMCSRAPLSRTRFAKQKKKKNFTPRRPFAGNRYSLFFFLHALLHPSLLSPAGEDV